MTNQDIGRRIDGVDGDAAPVDVDVLAAARARRSGATARVASASRTTGDVHAAVDRCSGAAVPDATTDRLAGLRVRRDSKGVRAMTRRLTRRSALVTLGLVLGAGRPGRAGLGGEVHRGRAGQGATRPPASTSSPHVVWILAVGSDARPGEDMTRTPRRRPPAGRHEHPDRRREPPSAYRATPGSTSPATATTRSTPRSTSAARSCSARRSATWSASSPTTSS